MPSSQSVSTRQIRMLDLSDVTETELILSKLIEDFVIKDRLTEGDTKKFSDIYRTRFATLMSQQGWVDVSTQYDKPVRIVWVAEEEGLIKGTMSTVFTWRKTKNYWVTIIEELLVFEEHRGRGIGKDLMMCALNAPAPDGSTVKGHRLTVVENDNSSRPFHEKFGFKAGDSYSVKHEDRELTVFPMTRFPESKVPVP